MGSLAGGNVPEQAPREPQFLEEVNTLLEAASSGAASLSLSNFEPEAPAQAELGFEGFVYRTCLRAIAAERARDRAEASEKITYLPSHFNECWELTTKKIAALALDPRTSFLARQHVVINEAKDSFNERWDELKKELYADQQPYALDLIASLQKAPKTAQYTDRQGKLRLKDVLGVTAVAPTGSGKTHLMEMCATVIADSAVHRSIVLVVPSLAALRQLLGKFREDLPHLRIGGMSSETHDPPDENELMILTSEAFTANFRNNHLDGHPVDMLMIDEVHHLTAPEFSQTWLEHWDGHTMGFTATPAYNLSKDVRAILPHVVEHSDIMSLIDDERLNDGQIFTFAIDDDFFEELAINYGIDLTEAASAETIRYAIDSLVIDFVRPLIQEGRRGIIFCEPGDTAWNARELARRLAETELDDGRTIQADAMYSEADNQHDIMERYFNGDLQVVTTVDTGRESLDAPFNFVIMDCTVKSRLRGKQITGRGTRRNEQFGVTIFAQFINNLISQIPLKHNPFLFEEAFDELPTEFHQGRTLRGYRSRQTPEGSQDSIQRRPARGAIDISTLSPLIQKALAKIDRHPVGESFRNTRQNAWIVEDGMQPLREALLGYDIHEKRARKILHNAGFTWRGKYEEVDGKKILVHYYSAEAIAHLHSKLPRGQVFNRLEAAARLGISAELFDYLVSQPANGIKGQEAVREGKKTADCYNEEAMAMAEIAVQKVPGTQPGDRPVQDVAEEMGIDKRGLQRLIGIQNSKRYFVNGAFHLTAAEIIEAKNVFYDMPEAQPTDKTLSAIAEKLEVDEGFVRKRVTDAEKAQGVRKRYKDKRGYTVYGSVWAEENWKPIVERLEKSKPRPLEAHLIHLNGRTLSAMLRFGSDLDVEELAKDLTEKGYTVEHVAIIDNKITSYCVTWPVIAALQRERGEPRLTRRTPKIDFDRLPAGPDDLDPGKIAYAQEIQQRFLRPEQLKRYEAG